MATKQKKGQHASSNNVKGKPAAVEEEETEELTDTGEDDTDPTLDEHGPDEISIREARQLRSTLLRMRREIGQRFKQALQLVGFRGAKPDNIDIVEWKAQDTTISHADVVRASRQLGIAETDIGAIASILERKGR